MIKVRLIAPRELRANFHVTGKPSLRFVNRNKTAAGVPAQYAVSERSNGAVFLYEYSSKEEYKDHKAVVTQAIARYHRSKGERITGCECLFCRMGL